MKIQKIFYACVIAIAGLLSVGSISSFANNSGNTQYTFNFPSGTNVDYTDPRPKYDSTSAWMKLKDLSGFATNPSYTASVVKENYSNFSKTWYYTFSKSNINQGVYLSNHAYEDNGYGVKVRIKAVGDGNNSFYGSGDWSPDSI